MHTHKLLPIFLACGLLLAACKVPGLESAAPQPPRQVTTPEVIPVAQSQAPSDIKLVTAALIERLRGGSVNVENVRFDPAGHHAVGENGFYYANFDVKDVAVTGYVTNPLGPGKAQVVLEGIFLFTDFANRRAGVYYAAQYIVTRSGVTITKSVAKAIPPDYPRVELFFVPAAKLKAAAAQLTSYLDYYLFSIENAEPMTYGPEGGKTGIKDDYYLLAFCKDRLFEESSLQMQVTTRPSGGGRKLAEPIAINDSGWRILIAGGKFAPGSSQNKFYVSVTYKMNPASQLPCVEVGDFRNVKSEYTGVAAQTAAPAATVPVGAASAPASAASGDGPLALGQQMLNPVFPADVAVIQTRLKELGYYKGKIDQDFGPMTRKALDAFNVRNGFPKGQWSLGVQKALFRGTGQ